MRLISNMQRSSIYWLLESMQSGLGSKRAAADAQDRRRACAKAQVHHLLRVVLDAGGHAPVFAGASQRLGYQG